MDEGNYEESVAKLDMQLTYLWRVHGIDYYGGWVAEEMGVCAVGTSACVHGWRPAPAAREGGRPGVVQ